MTDFDVIEFGYNVADETINFGTRCLADGDNLYEASTLATLKCSEQTGKVNPHINALVHEERIYCSIDTSMRIFKDKQCSDVSFNAAFESIIDTFSVSVGGDYLLVCLREGKVNLIHCSNEFNCVLSECCERDEDGDRFFINSFVDKDSFLIVTKLGQVYRISFEGKFKLESVFEFNLRVEIASFQYPFLLVNGTKFAILDVENNNALIDGGQQFKKIFPLPYMFLALDFEGNLFRICAVTLHVVQINSDTFFKDVQILSDMNHIQIITVAENEGQNCIQLLSYPDLQEIYSLKVPNQIHLFPLESLTDELLYISKISTDDYISEIRFHVVYETEPEQRLRRLLKKHQYEEAERFAKLFNLDPVLINKAKAQEITEKTILTHEDIENLINLLEMIEDDEFRLRCCMDVDTFCSSFNDVRRILTYGCRLQLKKERRAEAEELQKSVAHLMYRFDTFLTVYRGCDEKIQAWLRFAGCDLIEEVKGKLRNYKIEEAGIIYSRLDELTTENLTEEHIADILSVLNNLSIATYEPFLPTFIPITLSILPSTLPLFVEWTHAKVYNLEKWGRSDFPNNAIRFTEKIVGLMRVNDVGDIAFQRQCVLHRESLVELSTLLSALKTLKTLRDDYKITSIPVMGYLSGPQNVVRLLLTTELMCEDYDVFLRRFLCRYMVENHMEPNEILLGEISEVIKYEECYWMNKVPSILNCITSVRVKLEAIKTILDCAAVPWSETVRNIVNDSLKYSHPLTSEIRELIETEPMQIVLLKPQYKIKERRISTIRCDINNLKFVLNRIVYCDEPTMVQDVYQLCRTPESRHVANMLLIKHFIKKGNLEKALEVLDDNTPEEVLSCAQELAQMVETVNNEALLPEQLKNSYYSIASSIFRRLSEQSESFYRSCKSARLNLIKNVYNLKKNFKIVTTTHDLRSTPYRRKIVKEVLDEVNQEFETGRRTIEQVFGVCYELADSLDLDPHDVLIEFCENSGNYSVIFKTAQKICDGESSSKTLCSIAVLLMKYVGSYKFQLNDSESDCDASVLVTDSSDVVDDDLFCKGLQLAEVAISQALYKAENDEVASCLDIVNWVRTSFYFTRHQSELKRSLFGDIFDSGSVLPGYLTFSTIRKFFVAFHGFSSKFNLEPLTEEEFCDEVKALPPLVENMLKEGQHFTCSKIVETLQFSLLQTPRPNRKILAFLNEIQKKKCFPKVVSSILSNSTIDTDFLFNLLLACDRDDSIKFVLSGMKIYKRNPRKLAAITHTGLKLWDYYKISNARAEMLNTLKTMKWWRRFESKKLDYEHFFRSKPEDRFQFLVNSDCLDVKSAAEYCQDYKLDSKASYKYFLMKVFLNWKPDYETVVETHRKALLVKNSEGDLLKKCGEIIENIDKQHVVNIILKTWNCVNPYYYEVFIAMLLILGKIDPTQDTKTKLAMLIFLKNYQRVSKPGETEIEQWYTNFPDTQSLDVLSEFRLSFTSFLFTKQSFNIIRPELNLKTYKLWFNAIEILKPYLSKNEICSVVVKDVVASGVLAKSEDEWVLHAQHDDLLKEIDDCVMNISDLELTTSVVYYVMTHIPNGADQVNAAKLCYKYAVRYRQLNQGSSDVERAVIKVEKKYFTYCAMHILHTHQLAEKKYTNLLTQPNELILALYLDDRILRKNEVDLHCPDINKATEALAHLFNLDIKKIRVNLINSWLGDTGSSLDLDSSVIYPSGDGNDENLNRIAYVCCADDVASWQTQLVQIGLGKETERQRSVHCKARALKVFAMISDVDVITKLTGVTYDELLDFIDKYTLVSNLQHLGISLDVEALALYNKKELLNRLVQRAGNLLAIKTMALICMTHKIYDVKYWEFIINSTIKFSLFAELKTYVHFLNKAKYQHKSFYINAWQKLIDHSFTNLHNLQKFDQVLLSNLLTIQSCPVLFSLNLDNAFRQCMDMDKVEFAAVLLQYLDSNKREEYVKEIRNSKDLVASLNNLERNGLWGIAHVRTILEQSRT